MSAEFPSLNEQGLLPNDFNDNEVNALVESLESLRSRVQCIEGTEGFVGVEIMDDLCLNIDREGIELRFDVELGNSIAMEVESDSHPDPETVLQALTRIIEMTPAITNLGYERKSWGGYEESYTVNFVKSVDTLDLEKVYAEVETIIDCFAVGGETT